MSSTNHALIPIRLPELLERIAAASGLDVAVKIATEAGGTTINLPSRLHPNQSIVRLIGLKAAEAIKKHIGCGEVQIPMWDIKGRFARRKLVCRLLAEGFSVQRTALAADVHVRTVWRAKARRRALARQAKKSSPASDGAAAPPEGRVSTARQGGGVGTSNGRHDVGGSLHPQHLLSTPANPSTRQDGHQR